MKVEILRLCHRRERDVRVTTHVGLTGRALGASGFILSGQMDEGVLDSLAKVSENWGGEFETTYQKNWQEFLRQHGGLRVHLTMYGIPVEESIDEIRKKASDRGLLLVVGSEKVPGAVYELVDYNVSVTNQPISEISALALFLDRLYEGKELRLDFPGAKRRIIPSSQGKLVKMRNDDPTSRGTCRSPRR